MFFSLFCSVGLCVTSNNSPRYSAAAIKNNAKFDFLEGTAADLPAASAAAASTEGGENDDQTNENVDEKDVDNRS